jgi:hypothetical protein
VNLIVLGKMGNLCGRKSEDDDLKKKKDGEKTTDELEYTPASFKEMVSSLQCLF